MGSSLRLSVLGASAHDAERAWTAARLEMARTEDDLTRFRPDSALSRANRLAGAGGWFDAPPRLRRMLAISHRAMRSTGGRFDPRVIGDLEEIGERGGVLLPPPLHNAPWLARDGRDARFRLGAAADSGGIGKGLGLRWAMAAARRTAPAVAGMLLEAGGDLLASGSGPVDGGWSVGIEDPDCPDALLATVLLRRSAIATSSTAHRSWTHGGRRVHHLIDPRTGNPAATGVVAVTVASLDAAWAEVWTKALFLAGRPFIGEEARSRGLAAWWVEDDGSLHMTPAARALTTWQRSEVSAA